MFENSPPKILKDMNIEDLYVLSIFATFQNSYLYHIFHTGSEIDLSVCDQHFLCFRGAPTFLQLILHCKCL